MGKSSRKKRRPSRGGVAGGDSSQWSRNPRSEQLGRKPAYVERSTSRYYLAGIVSFFTLLVYLPSLKNQFVNWDDTGYIIRNPHIHPFNLDLVRWAFTEFYASNWHPLTWLSHAADYAIWGLNPLGHHLMNAVLHSGNTFLVVLLVIRVLEIYKEKIVRGGGSTFLDGWGITIVAGTTGMLFGVHPLHVETVAWIAQRKTLLCVLFALLSVVAYLEYVRGQGDPGGKKSAGAFFFDSRYIASFAFFILALCSKPMAVSLPVMLLILDWEPLRRIGSVRAMGVAVTEKLPFIACSLISSLLTLLSQHAGGATKLMEVVPFPTRVLVAAKALISYLWKIVLPINLIPFYPYPHDVSLLSPVYLGALLLLLAITSVLFITLKRSRPWLALWACYIVTLLPVLGLVQVGGQAMADRYAYFSSLGPFLAISLVAVWSLRNFDVLKGRRLSSRVIGGCAAILVSALLSFLTIRQIGVWSGSVELWNYVIKQEPETALAYNNRGQAFLEKGELDDALADFNKVIALNQSYETAYNNRGIILSKTGQLDKAMEDFDRAIALNPSYDEAYNQKGIIFGEKEQFDKAIDNFNRAIDLNPFHSRAYFNRGYVYLKRGDVESAVQNFRKACALGYEAACRAVQKIGGSPP